MIVKNITPFIAGWFKGKCHRSKWEMTGGSPMTMETSISAAAIGLEAQSRP